MVESAISRAVQRVLGTPLGPHARDPEALRDAWRNPYAHVSGKTSWTGQRSHVASPGPKGPLRQFYGGQLLTVAAEVICKRAYHKGLKVVAKMLSCARSMLTGNVVDGKRRRSHRRSGEDYRLVLERAREDARWWYDRTGGRLPRDIFGSVDHLQGRENPAKSTVLVVELMMVRRKTPVLFAVVVS